MRLFGEFVGREGLIFDVDPAVHFLDEVPTLERNWQYIVGIDTGTYFAAEFLAYDPGQPPKIPPRALFFNEVYTKRHTINENCRAIIALCEYYHIKPTIVVDRTSQFKADLSNHGLPPLDGPLEIHASIDAMKHAMTPVHGVKSWAARNPELFIGPACTRLRDRIMSYRWDSHGVGSKRLGTPKAVPAPGPNHGVDAARYALWYTRMPPGIAGDNEEKPVKRTAIQEIIHYATHKPTEDQYASADSPWLGEV
jgi:hypothetical protein